MVSPEWLVSEKFIKELALKVGCITMGLRNLIGDLLGFGRCPITNESYYGGFTNVWYTPHSGLLVAERATLLSPDQLAEAVYKFVIQDERAGPAQTSPEQIKCLNRLSELRVRRPGYLSRGGIDAEIESIRLELR